MLHDPSSIFSPPLDFFLHIYIVSRLCAIPIKIRVLTTIKTMGFSLTVYSCPYFLSYYLSSAENQERLSSLYSIFTIMISGFDCDTNFGNFGEIWVFHFETFIFVFQMLVLQFNRKHSFRYLLTFIFVCVNATFPYIINEFCYLFVSFVQLQFRIVHVCFNFSNFICQLLNGFGRHNITCTNIIWK